MMDVDTKEGMEEAVEWIESFLEWGKPVFTWAIPRSNAIYIIDKEQKRVFRIVADSSTDKVFKHMGWEVEGLNG